LDLRCEVPISFLHGPSVGPTGRTLEIAVAAAELTPSRPANAELLCDQRQPDGSAIFRIEQSHETGYVISGPTYGTHLLTTDGLRLRCLPTGRAEEEWQRLLIAQVLPFAALLRGLEVFHASAVVRDGEAIAFLGVSGAGKTSLALELCRRGAGFLADDVLALETGKDLLAHPGAPVAGVAHPAGDRSRVPGADLPGQTIAINDRERIVRMCHRAGPAPLSALFFLDRRAEGPARPHFEAVVEPRALLAATFNFVLATPERLSGLLEVCALAALRRVERIVVGPRVDVRELGGAVEHRLRSSS
jgi:hypothetical protein